MSEPKVLPADVYDTLELVAEAYGGIGGNAYNEYTGTGNERSPLCAFGCLMWAQVPLSYVRCISEDDNDFAVGPSGKRIPFAEWCKRLNVVRGE